MAKPRKVIRTKNLYKKQIIPPKVKGIIVFASLIILIITIGFILMHEFTTRFGNNGDKVEDIVVEENITEVEQSVEEVEDVEDVETEIVQLDISKTAFIDSNTISLGKTAIENKIDDLKSFDFTAIAFELKPDSGKLVYNSEVPEAVKYKAIEQDNDLISLEEIVKIAHDKEIIPVAYMSTLKDSVSAHVQNGTGYAYSTYTTTNWLDNSVDAGGKAWLNPYMENTQNYISDLVAECYDAGIEVIFLDNVIYPTKNTDMMNTLKTTPSKEQMLSDFVSIIEKSVPDATIIRVEDLTYTATIEEYKGSDLSTTNYNTVLSRCETENIAVYMSLDDISQRKEQIIIREDLSVDNKVDDIEVYELLLEKTIAVLGRDFTVVVNQDDFSQILPVLESLSVVSFIVINS